MERRMRAVFVAVLALAVLCLSACGTEGSGVAEIMPVLAAAQVEAEGQGPDGAK